jgi:hypothetical protein
MPLHRYIVTVRTEKSGGGTFKPADEIGEQIHESIQGADPGTVDVDGVSYETTEFDVEEIDVKGQPVPWTDEAEQRSRDRAEKRKKERVVNEAIARKKQIAWEAEQKRLREEKPDGRVFIHTFDGDTELSLDQYDRVVFEVPNENEGWHPLEVHIGRDRHDPRRIEIKNNSIGALVVRPRDSTCIQVEPTQSSY